MQILLVQCWKRIYVVGADPWVNFTRLPQNLLQAPHSVELTQEIAVFAKKAILE